MERLRAINCSQQNAEQKASLFPDTCIAINSFAYSPVNIYLIFIHIPAYTHTFKKVHYNVNSGYL